MFENVGSCESCFRPLESARKFNYVCLKILKDVGMCWKVLEGVTRRWKVFEGVERLWKLLKGVERCWKELEIFELLGSVGGCLKVLE
jgi:hypothetical protein